MRTLALTVVTVFVLGCSLTQPGENPNPDGDALNKFPGDSLAPMHLVMETRDTTGVAVSSFEEGEEIIIVGRLYNLTPDTVRLQLPDPRPFVAFNVWSGDSLVGNSLDGLAFVQIPSEATLPPESSIKHAYSWFSTDQHHPLKRGEYLVTPEMQVASWGPPAPEFALDSLTFTVRSSEKEKEPAGSRLQ